MRWICSLILPLFVLALDIRAQEPQNPLLNIGDFAPALRIRQWIKGTPYRQFNKGTLYVVEFWATWCKPCIAEMPHLSALASEYKNKVIILSIDVYEKKITSLARVTAFVDSMGVRMDYNVAAEDSNFMETGWLDAFDVANEGIPTSFVIDAQGRVAWIGHPRNLNQVLPKLINNTWNIKGALAERNFKRRLKYLDDEAQYKLINFQENPLKPGDLGKPDSIILLVNEMVRTEPKLKFMPIIAANTFASLLKTNPSKAYTYGKEMLDASTFEHPLGYIIIEDIEAYAGKINIPEKIYGLGIEACLAEIEQYPETIDIPSAYQRIAEWYWRIKDTSKAINAEQKAIEALKSGKSISKADMAELESRLRQYKSIN